jgi:peptide/nickel transport system substrate-binding protein
MKRRDLLVAGAATLAAGATAGLARPALAQKSSVLRFVPQANLANPDPIWTTATVAFNHGYMVWDTLYGLDSSLTAKPQMVGSQELTDNDTTWTITLRDGLLWHDNEPVRAIDCTTSIQRWWVKDPFGQQIHSLTNEITPLDDKRFQIKLKKPFPQLAYALGAPGCFIMPERIAQTPATEQIKEYIGSGPFRFIASEWVSGSRAAYEKFDKYVPRQEPPQYIAGGKVVHFDRVEWIVEPDPSTAASALQTGEVDWVEQPLIDLVPMLKQNADVVVDVFDPFGSLAMVAFNHLYPPFNNPKVLQALLPAISQKDYMEAVAGSQMSLAKYPVGFFTAGTPMANDAGMQALAAPRDMAKAKQLLKESGYNSEPVLLMSPSDQAALQAAAEVTYSLFKEVGLNVQLLSMDWGTLVSRRASMKPPSEGGWSSFCTTWAGVPVSNPGSSYPLRGNGRAGWFGWPTNPEIESLRQQWFDAPDLAAQKKVCEQIQLQAFQQLPFIPTGQFVYPTAYRNDLTGFVKGGQIAFWGVQRKNV